MTNLEIMRPAVELSISEGERFEATRSFSWTLYEFDDFPLSIESGDKGIATKIDRQREIVLMLWDKDEFPQIEKGLTFDEARSLKKLENNSKNGK